MDDLMKEIFKTLRKTWLVILIMAVFFALAVRTLPYTLGPVIKEFREAIK